MDTNEHPVYEAPELLELGRAEDVTLGDPTGSPDHCGCGLSPDFWLV